MNYFNGRDHRFSSSSLRKEVANKENQKRKFGGLNPLNIDYGKNIQSRMSF
jgi:hypothetical protein